MSLVPDWFGEMPPYDEYIADLEKKFLRFRKHFPNPVKIYSYDYRDREDAELYIVEEIVQKWDQIEEVIQALNKYEVM